MLVCDGLKHLPSAVAQVWPQTVVQACIVHLLRNSFRYASKKDWSAIAKALKPVNTAASEAEAAEPFMEFTEAWGQRYPAVVRLWESAWAEFVPFLAFDREIRTIICTTNAGVFELALSPGGQRPGTLPDRAGGAEMPLPDHDEFGPYRAWPQTLVQPVEGRVERLRDHLRRTPVRRPKLTNHKRDQLHR